MHFKYINTNTKYTHCISITYLTYFTACCPLGDNTKRADQQSLVDDSIVVVTLSSSLPPLLRAAGRGDLYQVVDLLRRSPQSVHEHSSIEDGGQTALTMAASGGHARVNKT